MMQCGGAQPATAAAEPTSQRPGAWIVRTEGEVGEVGEVGEAGQTADACGVGVGVGA
jgi:hypothetical protein